MVKMDGEDMMSYHVNDANVIDQMLKWECPGREAIGVAKANLTVANKV